MAGIVGEFFGIRFPRNEARKILEKFGENSEQNSGRIRDKNSKNSGNFRSATFLTKHSVSQKVKRIRRCSELRYFRQFRVILCDFWGPKPKKKKAVLINKHKAEDCTPEGCTERGSYSAKGRVSAFYALSPESKRPL